MTSKCGRFILPVVVFTFIIVSCPVYALGCVYLVSNLIELALYLLIFSVLFIVLLWSFLATVFTPVATVPPNYKLTDQEFELLSTKDGLEKNKLLQTYIKGKNLLIQTRSSAGSVRYCLKCKHLKPDRAHHCSTCGVCVLKMDHHCPWVNNCIGFSNQKFFILLHFYTTLYCSYIVCTSIRYVVPMHDDYLLDYYVVCFIVIAFYGTFGATLLIIYSTLMCRSETYIDKMQKQTMVVENSTYNLGCRQNFLQVFGDKWCLWPVPVFTSPGTGCTFPMRTLNASSSNA